MEYGKHTSCSRESHESLRCLIYENNDCDEFHHNHFDIFSRHDAARICMFGDDPRHKFPPIFSCRPFQSKPSCTLQDHICIMLAMVLLQSIGLLHPRLEQRSSLRMYHDILVTVSPSFNYPYLCRNNRQIRNDV